MQRPHIGSFQPYLHQYFQQKPFHNQHKFNLSPLLKRSRNPLFYKAHNMLLNKKSTPGFQGFIYTVDKKKLRSNTWPKIETEQPTHNLSRAEWLHSVILHLALGLLNTVWSIFCHSQVHPYNSRCFTLLLLPCNVFSCLLRIFFF